MLRDVDLCHPGLSHFYTRRRLLRDVDLCHPGRSHFFTRRRLLRDSSRLGRLRRLRLRRLLFAKLLDLGGLGLRRRLHRLCVEYRRRNERQEREFIIILIAEHLELNWFDLLSVGECLVPVCRVLMEAFLNLFRGVKHEGRCEIALRRCKGEAGCGVLFCLFGQPERADRRVQAREHRRQHKRDNCAKRDNSFEKKDGGDR